MDLFSPRHLLIILVIVLLVFGTKKLKTIGSDLGQAVRGFKESMRDAEAAAHDDTKEPAKQLAGTEAAQKPAGMDKPAEKAASTPADKTTTA